MTSCDIEPANVTAQPIIRLSEIWALGYDTRQWVIQRRAGVWKTGGRRGEEIWRALSFIGSNKAVLLRVLREKGVEPTAAAQRALDALPETFRQFYEQQAGMDGTVRRQKHTAHRDAGIGRPCAKPGLKPAYTTDHIEANLPLLRPVG